ncbi:MAG TPA: hypothetical protein VL418_08435 [Devosiaceae bacterium]|nr:hypothetical protein [Devosiaceae bacterium]
MFKAAALFSSLLLSAGIAGVLSFAQPAMASAGEGEIGTPAFTNHALPLYTDSLWRGRIVGTLPGGLPLYVDRCTQLWCQVHGKFGHGWVFLYSLSFGEGPNSIWWPQWVRHPEGYHPFRKGIDY